MTVTTSFWFALGEYDTVEIKQLLDNVSAAAFSVAVLVGGALKAIKTTPERPWPVSMEIASFY